MTLMMFVWQCKILLQENDVNEIFTVRKRMKEGRFQIHPDRTTEGGKRLIRKAIKHVNRKRHTKKGAERYKMNSSNQFEQ
jgi:ABC-type enterochelin transport system ATPase subunit